MITLLKKDNVSRYSVPRLGTACPHRWELAISRVSKSARRPLPLTPKSRHVLGWVRAYNCMRGSLCTEPKFSQWNLNSVRFLFYGTWLYSCDLACTDKGRTRTVKFQKIPKQNGKSFLLKNQKIRGSINMKCCIPYFLEGERVVFEVYVCCENS